jgi:hypothetical protein
MGGPSRIQVGVWQVIDAEENGRCHDRDHTGAKTGLEASLQDTAEEKLLGESCCEQHQHKSDRQDNQAATG